MRKYFKSTKGSSFALQALVGIVLSIMALVFLIPLLFNFFNPQASNLEIAKDNVNSIINFVDFAHNSKYNVMENCYFGLRLYNLENFQNTGSESYSYLISSNGIYILSEDYPSLILNLDHDTIKRNSIYFKEFSQDINSVGLFRCGLFGRCSLVENSGRQILQPGSSNQNAYELYTFQRVVIRVHHSTGEPVYSDPRQTLVRGFQGYFYYSLTDRSILFPSNPESLSYLNQNLCSHRFFFDRDFEVSITSFNPLHMRATVKTVGLDPIYSFKWDRKGICLINNQEVSCSEVFSTTSETNDFENFINQISLLGATDVYLEDIESLTKEEIENLQLNIQFSDVFINRREHFEFFQVKMLNFWDPRWLTGRLRFEPRDEFSSRTINFPGGNLNKDPDKPYNFVVNQNNNLFFYVQDFFYMLNINTLSRERVSPGNYVIFFGNKQVENLRVTNSNFGRVYSFEIEVEGKRYSAVISNRQFQQINLI